MQRTIANPPSPYTGWVDWEVPPPDAELRVYVDDSRSILSRNDSEDLPFRYSVNPYRGCFHACAYCYARSSHEHLGFGSGTDFDRKLLVKTEAPALLAAALQAPSWRPEVILFSGNTDCYQPIELQFRLTRACLAVCLAAGNPVSVITKSALVERDADLLAALAAGPGGEVTVSIPFDDPAACRAIEPGAPPPARRYAAIAALARAGVPVGVNIAPMIPGLNDRDIPAILRNAHQAGAQWAHLMPVRLPGAVEATFRERLQAAYPDRAAGVLAKIRRMRGGTLNVSRFGARFRGVGAEWEATRALFQLWRAKLGYSERPPTKASPPRSRSAPEPPAHRQVSLFGRPSGPGGA
ncbi:hypothetical protein LBMAG42_01800 [Deltaproteobacteria bacterium]|nr:hypothetical protein LBMAG42_01800 [Deltaproteobacteria bacterium]